MTAYFRASGMTQSHFHQFGEIVEDDRHETVFTEASVAGSNGGTSWIGGLAYQLDSVRSRTFPAFDYTYRAPAVFAQVEHDVDADLTLAGSARADFHGEFGTQFSPRLSLLYRPGPWTVRVSGGRGFFAPTPLVEEIEAAGLSRLEPIGDLEAETATTASLDVGYTSGPLEATLMLFGSDIRNATRLETLTPERVHLVNAAGDTSIRGGEILLRYRWNGRCRSRPNTPPDWLPCGRSTTRGGSGWRSIKRASSHSRTIPIVPPVARISRLVSWARSPSARPGCSSTRRTSLDCGKPSPIRYSGQLVCPMGGGPWMSGLPRRGSPSAGAFGSASAEINKSANFSGQSTAASEPLSRRGSDELARCSLVRS